MGRSTSKGKGTAHTPPDEAVVVNGYTLLFHPALVAQLEQLILGVTRDGTREPKSGTQSKGTAATSSAKVLAHLYFAMLGEIPANPAAAVYRQGSGLGDKRRHWFRDKFGAGRFRLFFRFRQDLRLIVYGWVNDSETLRAYGTYRRFGQMLEAGTPPDDWPTLLAQAQAPESSARTRGALASAKKVIK